MKNLIKFELRKILTKRFAVISVAAVLLLSLILSFSTLHSMYAFDGTQNTFIKMLCSLLYSPILLI